jgi:hypothetical protein
VPAPVVIPGFPLLVRFFVKVEKLAHLRLRTTTARVVSEVALALVSGM